MDNITCTLLEQLELDLKVKFIVIGLACGYSDEGIIHYLRARYDTKYEYPMHSDRNPAVDTGYVAAPSELDKAPEVLFAEINRRRLLTTIFPAEPKSLHNRTIYEQVTNNPIYLARFHQIYNTIRQHIDIVD